MKVAIVGAGPGGLSCLNEFLHTDENGNSTIVSTNGDNVLPEQSYFKELVVFEQNSGFGGVWNHSEESDPKFLRTKEYSKPCSIRAKVEVPKPKDLEGCDVLKPFTRSLTNASVNRWNKSGVYNNLYTNVPNPLMRFSSGHVPSISQDQHHPFVHHSKVLSYVTKFVKDNDLEKYIRYNTCVEKVVKVDNKWIITVASYDYENGEEKWYLEWFDSVVVAVGRFNFPFYPTIENLEQFDDNNPGVIQHTKSIRDERDFKNMKVLLVGGSISAADILQYLIATCREVHISTEMKNDEKVPPRAKWIKQVFDDESLCLIKHPRIKKFDGNKVVFQDGSIEEGFDKIILATGYHIHYPFLDFPENKDAGLVNITASKDIENDALKKVDNLYLYTFSQDPTICYLGLANTPYFFLIAEAGAMAIAGVWSKAKQLPSIEEQKKWIKNRNDSPMLAFGHEEERMFVKDLYDLLTTGRVNMLDSLVEDEILKSKTALKSMFYKEIERLSSKE